ncbi:uncharacterized protein Dana_GF11144, isoform I [Drosophila ananassae]|uniref:Uncharacterized protein, isoform I n=1 Tax=Drosophila ananassae TaxID=7217 RepID=A0A0P8XRJ3_DROAN|nr:uncharacterized protein LOC6494009 isoform X6 [Drosophila ananassae]KPU77189.1 uncharacterized protein Dana_GF11144, isoform I [Drosophila ananassae]
MWGRLFGPQSSWRRRSRRMSLVANLIVALGFVFAVFIVSQLIFLAKRIHDSRTRRIREQRAHRADRQGNVFTVPEERSHNRYGDIFFIEPGSEEANRIREQLEKDEKELPSYDEVMRMCNLTTPTSAAAPLPQSALPEPLGPIGIPALPAPPYSETDPHLDASGATVIAMEPVQPSTSRAAQILPTAAPPATPSPATQTTV